MVKIIDRRNQAIGGQTNDRTLNAITKLGVHWDGVANGTIGGHERYWLNALGWSNGGYHYFVDKNGVGHWNYNLTKTTNGVGGHNGTSAHICYAGNHSHPMNAKQKETIKYIINELMLPNLPNVKQILGHNEFPNTSRYNHKSNSCPGIDMDEFRKYLEDKQTSKPVTPQVSKPKPAPSKPKTNVISGAKLVKHENGRFTVTASGIKVRTAPSTQARETGMLKTGNQINYDAVYEGNGYRWLRYKGASGRTLYLPYRPSNNVNDQWGTFGGSKPNPKPKPKQAWTGQVLKQGSRGPAVRQLQEMLSAKHYYPDKGAPNNGVDGIYGAKTKNAVERFQLINGLSVDGIAGRATYNSLR